MSVAAKGEQAVEGEGKPRRRSWSLEEKRRLVAETFAPGASVSMVARRYDLNTNMLFTWRREMAAGKASESALRLIPATITAEVPTPALPAPTEMSGRMEIVLAGGDRLIVGADVDAAALARVVKASGAAMIPVPSGVRVWLSVGRTDMRKGMKGLALQVQEALGRDPHAGDLYVFRGARGDLIKVIWHDGIGMSLYAKRLERGRFLWPSPADGTVAIRPRSSPICSTASIGGSLDIRSDRNGGIAASVIFCESTAANCDSIPGMEATPEGLPEDVEALKSRADCRGEKHGGWRGRPASRRSWRSQRPRPRTIAP